MPLWPGPSLSSLSSSLPTLPLADPIPDPLAYFLTSENTRLCSAGLNSGYSHFWNAFPLYLHGPLNCSNLTFPVRVALSTLLKLKPMLLSTLISTPIFCFILHSICHCLTYQIIYLLCFYYFFPLQLEYKLHKGPGILPFCNWCYYLKWSLAHSRCSINVLNW